MHFIFVGSKSETTNGRCIYIYWLLTINLILTDFVRDLHNFPSLFLTSSDIFVGQNLLGKGEGHCYPIGIFLDIMKSLGQSLRHRTGEWMLRDSMSHKAFDNIWINLLYRTIDRQPQINQLGGLDIHHQFYDLLNAQRNAWKGNQTLSRLSGCKWIDERMNESEFKRIY